MLAVVRRQLVVFAQHIHFDLQQALLTDPRRVSARRALPVMQMLILFHRLKAFFRPDMIVFVVMIRVVMMFMSMMIMRVTRCLRADHAVVMMMHIAVMIIVMVMMNDHAGRGRRVVMFMVMMIMLMVMSIVMVFMLMRMMVGV